MPVLVCLSVFPVGWGSCRLEAQAISPNVPATNGLLHVMDTVIIPTGRGLSLCCKVDSVSEIMRPSASGFVYPDKTLRQLEPVSAEN